MPKPPTLRTESSPETLKGWNQIATYLGLPISTAQRWGKSGMPIHRQGRSVQATPEELNRWMERETSEPVHIATASADLSSELRRGLSYVKKQKQRQRKKTAA
jgi:predicted site-specific integrase-resolvase